MVLWSAFLLGFGFSFAHCLGMCGGLVMAASQLGGPFGQRNTYHLLYGLGRTVSYSVLGLAAGTVGSAIALGSRLVGWQNGLSLLSGALLILTGLGLAGWIPKLSIAPLEPGRRFLEAFRIVARANRWWVPVGLGMLNGFLPCGLVYSALAIALSRGGAVAGALAMAAFGLGTIPAMLLLGVLSRHLGLGWRRRLRTVGALVVMAAGGATMIRGGWFVS